MAIITENEILKLAEIEERNYNWEKAASLHDKLMDYFLSIDNKESALQEYHEFVSNSLEAFYNPDSKEGLMDIVNQIFEVNKKIKITGVFGNMLEDLECDALIKLVRAIYAETLVEAEVLLHESLEIFTKLSESCTENGNHENNARILCNSLKVVRLLSLIMEDQAKIELILDMGDQFATTIWNFSKNSGNLKYLADSIEAKADFWHIRSYVKNLKDNEKWELLFKEFLAKCDESEDLVKNCIDQSVLAKIYYAIGVAYFNYGFFFVEDDFEQREHFNKGFDFLEKSLFSARKAQNKFLIILLLFLLNYYAFVAGRVNYIQKRIINDITEIEVLGSLYKNSILHRNFSSLYLPALYYSNISQMRIFTSKQRISYAEKAIEYALKGFDTKIAALYKAFLSQSLTLSFSQLVLLAKEKEKKNIFIQKMFEYANQTNRLVEKYEGGVSRAIGSSSLYRANKTAADLAESKEEKVKLLIIAAKASEENIKNAFESRTGKITAKLRIGLLYEELGVLTSNISTLIKASSEFSNLYNECIERNYQSYAGAACEYIARIKDRIGDHVESANFYKKAKSAYKISINNVEYRPLKRRISEKKDYAGAWNLIENAKAHHKKENHLKAKESYEKAVEILKNLPSFSYESAYYSAWAIQEKAEHLSKLERHPEAIEKYTSTQAAFDSSIKAFNNASQQFNDKFTLERIKKLERVARLRIKYCSARANVERARILGKQGEYCSSAELFASAATEFKDVCNLFKNERERGDLEAVYYLCRAWETMELAEKFKDSERFSEAKDLFFKASNRFNDSKLKLLASGNSAFCQALELGCKFDEADDYDKKTDLYPKIRTTLRKAATSYEKGGFEKGSDWALATSTYFDAGWSLIQADNELKFEERKKLLTIGSEYLKSAANLFKKAGYEDKENEVLKRLNAVEKEESIIFSALNSIEKPSISGSTTGIIAPSCSIETSQSPRLGEVTQFTQEEQKNLANKGGKKYEIIYRDLFEEFPRPQKREIRVGIAQIGVSESGNIIGEFYNISSSGLLGMKSNKINSVRKNVKTFIENAHKEGINILLFPEMSIDLNFGEFFEDISNLAKLYEMYIIPGSYHDQATKRNITVVFGPNGILWEQEKHIPAMIQVANNKFKENIEVGTLPRKLIVSNTEFGRIAIVICRDFLDMDLRVELKNFEPSVDIILNPAFTPVTADFKAIHFDARRSLYAYCFFANIGEFGDSLIYTPEKDRTERTVLPKQEGLIYKDIDLFKLRAERKKWEKENEKESRYIQSTK